MNFIATLSRPLGVGLTVLGLMLNACSGGGQKQADSDQKEGQTDSKTADKETEAQKTITIKGSDTAEELVRALAKAFRNAGNEDIDIRVEGGGSGLGITSLIDRNADMANASRPIKDQEVKRAQDNGVNPNPFVIAEDGLALIVHADNPVEGLDMQQVSGLYQGKINQWKEVGGTDSPVVAYSRSISSGTYVYFRDNAVKGDYGSSVVRKDGNKDIVQAVRNDPQGIGYVGLGYALKADGSVLPGLRVLPIAKTPNARMASPLKPENIISGDYPLARPLYHYINGQPEGIVAEFLRFEMSPKGREVIEQVGFYPPTEAHQKNNQRLLQGDV